MGLPFFTGKYNQSGVVAAFMANKDVPGKFSVALKQTSRTNTYKESLTFKGFLGILTFLLKRTLSLCIFHVNEVFC